MKKLARSIFGRKEGSIGWKWPIRGRRASSFPGSKAYWEQRYATGGHSGAGSYGKFAVFKAEVLNEFVAAHRPQSVIEFGCGDGNQLRLVRYPKYLGFDVSETAVSRCRGLFASDDTKSFQLMRHYKGERADAALSLDVIFHLVEDDVYEEYMETLFAAAIRHVVIYSSNFDEEPGSKSAHVRHRNVTRWIRAHVPGWQLVNHVPNRYPYDGNHEEGSFADFFIYEKAAGKNLRPLRADTVLHPAQEIDESGRARRRAKPMKD